MEEDNGNDVYKAFTKSSIENTLHGKAKIEYKTHCYEAKVSLHGNIACVDGSSEEANVPLIFVLEKVVVKKLEPAEKFPELFGFELCFSSEDENLKLWVETEDVREKWMIKMATCTHQMALAELDELAYKFYTMTPSTTAEDVSSEGTGNAFQNFYLTAPIKVSHNFAISQQNNLPARRLTVDEVLWETKLSLLLPKEMVKFYKKLVTEFIAILELRQSSWPPFVLPSLYDAIRELRDVIETYEQCSEFIENYNGAYFRKSTEKHRVAFGMVPTNLHVHGYQISTSEYRDFVTAGTASAVPFRFQHGGITKMHTQIEIDRGNQDLNFWVNRQNLLDLKKNIGDVSHKLDVEWRKGDSKGPEVCTKLHERSLEIYEKLKTISSRIASVNEFTEILYEEGKRRKAAGFSMSETKVTDSMQNLLDNLDSSFVSYSTKAAVFGALDDKDDKSSFEESVRKAMTTVLDQLLVISDAVLEAQLLSLVISLNKSSIARTYFNIQLRYDFVISQVATIGATAILNKINKKWTSVSEGETEDLLLVVFSFLSAYGDEKGMIEDAIEAWKSLEARIRYRVVRAPSAVCKTCIPIVQGSRAAIKISIPLPHDIYDELPEELRNKKEIAINTAYFNIGVNHEATFGQSFGGLSFEAAINSEAANRMNSFANRNNASTQAREAVMELVNEVAKEASKKNLGIFEWAMTSAELLGGEVVLSCKSGKDRTGMAATLEQTRVLKETCGFNQIQINEVLESLRKDGVRRENCRKNVGRPTYSFSPFQMHFLPKQFRPPAGTYAQGVSS